MQQVFGEDKLGQLATALFQCALQPRTYENYGSNLRSFFTVLRGSTSRPSRSDASGRRSLCGVVGTPGHRRR